MLEFMQFELQSFFNQQSALIHSYFLQQCFIYLFITTVYRGKCQLYFISSTFSVETLDC